jgi:signal transduction histidine kinase
MSLLSPKKLAFTQNMRVQLLAGFLILGIFFLIVSLPLLFLTNTIQFTSQNLLREKLSHLEAAKELDQTLTTLNASINNYLLDHDPRWLQLNTQKQLHWRTWLAIAHKRAAIPAEQALVDSLDRSFQHYLALQQLLLNLDRRGQKRQVQELRTGALQSQQEMTQRLCHHYYTRNTQMLAELGPTLQRQTRRIKWLVIGGTLISLTLSVGLGILFSRRFVRPIYRLVLNIKGATGTENSDRVELGNISELDDLSQNVNLLINKIRAVNADLAKSQQSLIRSEKLAALGRMAAGLAHEIRNPLTAIKMLLYTLSNELRDQPHYQQDLKVIHQEIDRLEKFIQTFLDFARPQQPQLALFRFHECIQQVLRLLTPQIKKQKVKLALSLKTNADWVKADRNQMQQVLYNIILNALQAMPNGGLLTISSESLIADNGWPYLQIRIADTGRGIPPEILNSLFDPFVTTKEDGSGLGLAIVHQLIQANNGWVEATNNPDQGACFTINLPQEKSDL